MIRILFIIILMTSWFACQDQNAISERETVHPMDRLGNDEAGDIIRKAIAFAGGWDAWSSKQNFTFYKVISKVDSTGVITKKIKQLHHYNMKPGFQSRMTWKDKEGSYLIVNTGNEAKKYKNKEVLIDDKSKKEAWNSSFGSNYVISMPFKFTDPGTILTYEGIDSTTLDRPVYSVKVEYEEGAGSSGGYHTWWYYFDVDNYDLVANYLDSGNGYSLTTYETFTEVDDIRIHVRRLSYASNEQKEKVMLKTIYENEEMTFDSEIDKSNFQFL